MTSIKNKKISKASESFDSKEVVAKLRNCPTSPRKMRLVVDQIRGLKLKSILLKHSTKDASIRLEKLLLSAIANCR